MSIANGEVLLEQLFFQKLKTAEFPRGLGSLALCARDKQKFRERSGRVPWTGPLTGLLPCRWSFGALFMLHTLLLSGHTFLTLCHASKLAMLCLCMRDTQMHECL